MYPSLRMFKCKWVLNVHMQHKVQRQPRKEKKQNSIANKKSDSKMASACSFGPAMMEKLGFLHKIK